MAITRQLGDVQDHVVKGSFTINNDEYDYISAMDGHGNSYTKDVCITLLRNMDFDIVAQSPNPVEYIQSQLVNYNLFNTGSTFTFARINKTQRRIEVINIGDSMTAVFKNNKLIYTTPKHCFQNSNEIERTKSLVTYIRQQKAPFPINDTDVHLIELNVGVWNTGEILVPTQSFGHNNMTGIDPSCEIIYYEPEDKVRIICGTDGFWDMKMIDYPYIALESAIRLVNVAERKWKQQWMYYDGINTPVQTTFEEADDIGIAVWDN